MGIPDYPITDQHASIARLNSVLAYAIESATDAIVNFYDLLLEADAALPPVAPRRPHMAHRIWQPIRVDRPVRRIVAHSSGGTPG